MRLNPNTPYQAQQQLHQQQQQHSAPPSSASLQQQRHQQQQQLHNPTSQQTTNAVPPPRNNMMGVFNSNQQQNSWSAQQQPQTGYLPSTKMMQPTPPPPAAATPAANCWPQQQPTAQQQQNYQNVNMYQQPQQNTVPTQPPLPTQQQWPQNPQQPATYDNYYQQQPAVNNNNMFQQQPQPVAAPSPATFFQQQQTTQATQNPVNFFDTTNNNQAANNAGDGWDDWGWNDNNTITTETTQTQQENNTQTPLNANQSSAFNNSSVIADSFNSQNNNDAWNWGTGVATAPANNNEQHVATTKETTQQLDNKQPTTQNDSWNWPTNANDNEKLQQQQQHQQQQQQQQIANSTVPLNNEQHNDNWNRQTTTTTNENQQHLAKTAAAANVQASSTPPPPPPTEFSSSSSAVTENHNYNTNPSIAAPASTSPGSSNIPNTVFVSQAKPVTLPSRQYASPPGGNTPVTEHPPETALMPPQAFQNVEEPATRPQAIQSPALQPPNVATPPPALSSLPPPSVPPPAANAAAGNPFKRSGVAQHHRASNLMATTSSPAAPLTAPNVFSMPPPPPADFANPASVSLLEPDNNELPSQENQEVLSPPSANITLPNTATQPPPPTSSITLPNSNVATPPQPLNDERNQYLQTSHLSENSEEQQQPEADGLLPPPGLSRLVLGEPELEASQQRMVMGTEAPQPDNAVNQAAVMHLEERHADGEDTASEHAVPVTSLAGQAAPPSTSAPTSDRNLYLVPGESNNPTNNQQPQRVVTGVELAEQREIDMDGENLEDEQIHQQQQQQQQHHHQQQQQHHQHQHHPQHHQHSTHNQHPHAALSPEARNEPPVEGADDNVAAPPAIVTPVNPIHSVEQNQDHHSQHHHHHSSNQLAKNKDTNTISSPNDDDDSDDRLLNERVQSTAGSSKSRSKYENDRLTVPSSRRRDKRSSVERYESDEYLNSEGEYSSEREERERRERDRRRNYREGSVRSDRGGINDEDEKRSRRHRGSNKRDKYYYADEERSRGGGRDDRDRTGERSKAERRRQRGYDNDSRYETEESTRFESRKDPARRSMRRSDRSDQGNDYDDYNRRSGYRSSKRAPDNYESDRRDRRRSDKHREPRYRDDPRYDPREYEDYRKHSSRNARESDMEKEAAGASSRSGRMHHDPRHAAMYGYPSGGYYDPYTAYYYQQMARTNPQAYAEWYKKYYGQAAVSGVVGQGVALPGAGTTTDTSLPATGNDGRESVHSGRSSAHNDMKDRSGALSVRDPDPVALEPQRLTPCKFINEHTVVSFASGILVTVKPKYTPNGSISNIVKLLKFKPNDETRKLFKVFPGPLVRGLTHKKTVIEFCHEQIRLGPMETTIYAKQLISNNAEKYRASYTLMWNLLILLLKQNGMVVGTDIAELLLKNQQQFPYQTPISTANNSLKSKSGTASPVEDLELNKDSNEEAQEPLNPPETAEPESLANDKDSSAAAAVTAEQDDTEDNSLTKSSSNSNALTEDEITEKFRNYLLYGNVNEALEWATDNNLWGHALFLASKLDRRSHANVMMKFANKLSLNDPLQTLYQLMSGRTPSSVTCVQDEKWGDWRPHLSMILSNTSQKPELDRKAITTLGDSLFNRGDLYAAHFCYLMAQVGFGRYQESATQETSLQQHLPKLVLLGSSHYKQFQEFAHNEAIVMTEIYEYACSLNDEKFSIVEFQPYKFLLATRLLDYGFHLKSLMYLEQIAVHIARDPTKYESSFINKVYELADRLKYYDPVLEKTIDDQQPGSDDANSLNLTPQQMEEQKWLQNLRQLALQYKQDLNTSNILPAAGSLQDNQYQQTTQDPNYYNHQQQQIDQQFMEINKQFSELNLQYQQPTTGTTDNQQQPMFYNPEQQQQLSEQTQVLDPYQQQQQQAPQQSLSNELPLQNAKDLQQPGGVEDHQQQDMYQQQQYLQPGDVNQQTSTNFSGYYDPSQYNAVDAAGSGNLDAANPTYDYWGQQQQPTLSHMGEENARPTISMPKSKTYDTDDEGANNKQQQQQSSATGNEAQKKQQQQTQQQQQKAGKKDDKDANKNQQQSNQNSGWFGGIWNKFSLKPKNQMILPDDKNPSIVWDPEKKKWVNTDGDEDEQETLKPPPKMSDLMPQQQQQQQQQPPSTQQQQQAPTQQIPFMDPQQMQQPTQFVPNSMPQTAPSPNPLQQQQNQPQQPAPAKTPTLQSNMFKMQRNRTLKNAYVDVFNPSGAPVNKAAENILAPALPPAAVPQGGFFIPGGSTSQTATDNSSQQQDQQYQQQQNTPQFYNPNQFTSGTGY